jgi:hypothetical protein
MVDSGSSKSQHVLHAVETGLSRRQPFSGGEGAVGNFFRCAENPAHSGDQCVKQACSTVSTPMKKSYTNQYFNLPGLWRQHF